MIRLWLLLLLVAIPSFGAEADIACPHFARLARDGRLPDFTGVRLVVPQHATSPVSTSERTLEADVSQKILPYIQGGTTGEFQGVDGVNIRYHVFEPPRSKGTIVISHGRGDSLSQFLETIQNFGEWGYTVYFIEHRGHGGSGRMVSNPHKVHVERFDDYVTDLETLINDVVLPNQNQKPTVLGHSMGGLIASRYAARNPDKIDKLVLVAPMMRPKLKGIPEPVARGIMAAVKLMGAKQSYAIGEKDFQYDMSEPQHPRQAWLQGMVRTGDYHAGGSGGSTYGWVGQALKAASQGRAEAPRIKTETLTLLAERDGMVDQQAIINYCKGHPNCGLLFLAEASHSPLSDPDRVRNQAMTGIREFLSNDNNN